MLFLFCQINTDLSLSLSLSLSCFHQYESNVLKHVDDNTHRLCYCWVYISLNSCGYHLFTFTHHNLESITLLSLGEHVPSFTHSRKANFLGYLKFQTFAERDLRNMHAKHAENCEFWSYFIWWKALFWKGV
jgi:hypothetical protein